MVLPELEASDADVPGEGHEYEDILTLKIEIQDLAISSSVQYRMWQGCKVLKSYSEKRDNGF